MGFNKINVCVLFLIYKLFCGFNFGVLANFSTQTLMVSFLFLHSCDICVNEFYNQIVVWRVPSKKIFG